MNELIEFLTSKEIIVVYIVVAVACVLCFAIYLIDKNYYKRKRRHNTKELNKLVEEVNEIIEEDYEETPVEVFDSPVLETITEEPYTAKVQPVVEEVIEKNPIVTFVDTIEEVESLEIEEPIKVEDLVLDTMIEPVVEVETLEENIEEEIKEEVVEQVNKQAQQEELSYTTIEPNRQQAQAELMRLTEELEKAEQEQKNIDLTAYEEEQEENAIISLEELVRKSKEMYEANELTQYADEGNEPISLEDLERRMNKVQEEIATIEEPAITTIEEIEESPQIIATVVEPIQEKLVLDDFNTIKLDQPQEIKPEEPVVEVKPEPVKSVYQAYQTTKKFERSPVISPIYGIERKETSSDLELENTANYEKLDEEIKKTNEFLMTLKELQKNLD